MTDRKGLPVHGYRPQSDLKIALVNEFKQDEERLLRKIEVYTKCQDAASLSSVGPGATEEQYQAHLLDTRPFDPRWLVVAKTHFQEGFMALNRAVFQPGRVKLPEDE